MDIKKENQDFAITFMVMIKNITVIIVFGILAIVFQKWWIALFSILFWSGYSYKTKETIEKGE